MRTQPCSMWLGVLPVPGMPSECVHLILTKLGCLKAELQQCGGRREPLSFTVAASTITDNRLWISPGIGSNYGKCVNIWAPGSNILSASASSDTATE